MVPYPAPPGRTSGRRVRVIDVDRRRPCPALDGVDASGAPMVIRFERLRSSGDPGGSCECGRVSARDSGRAASPGQGPTPRPGLRPPGWPAAGGGRRHLGTGAAGRRWAAPPGRAGTRRGVPPAPSPGPKPRSVGGDEQCDAEHLVGLVVDQGSGARVRLERRGIGDEREATRRIPVDGDRRDGSGMRECADVGRRVRSEDESDGTGPGGTASPSTRTATVDSSVRSIRMLAVTPLTRGATEPATGRTRSIQSSTLRGISCRTAAPGSERRGRSTPRSGPTRTAGPWDGRSATRRRPR